MLDIERRRICNIALEDARSNFLILKYEMASIIQDSLDAEDKAYDEGMNKEYYNRVFRPLHGLKIVVLPKDYYCETDGEINPKYDDVKFDGIRFEIDGEQLEQGLFEDYGPIVVVDTFNYLENPTEENYLEILKTARNIVIDDVLKDWDYSYNKEKNVIKNELEYYVKNSKDELLGLDTFSRGNYCLPNDTSNVIIKKVIYGSKKGITNNKYDVMGNTKPLTFNNVNYEIIELFDLRVNNTLKNMRKVSGDSINPPIIIEFPSINELEKYMSYLHTRYILCDKEADNSMYAKVLK